MGDNWDDDDWEAAADLVDEDKFAGEDDGLVDSWDAPPAPKVKKGPVESKYAHKDREYALKASGAMDNMTKEERQRAIEDGDIAAAADLFGGEGGAAKLDAMMPPKTNAEFDKFAKLLAESYITVHSKSKQYKYFVKQLCKAMVDPMLKDEIKDVETCIAGCRSDKVKEELLANKLAKKGAKKTLRMEENDISAGMDTLHFQGHGDVDDDLDFM